MNTEMSLPFPVSLFPEDKRFSVKRGKEFLKGLASVEGLFRMAEEALINTKRLDLRSFDPLGMDCACHVHAFYIATIGREILAKSAFVTTLESSLESIQSKRVKVHTLYESLRDNGTLEKKEVFKKLVAPFNDQPTLKKVLQKLDLVVDLSVKVHCLIICYLLTITKDHKQITAENKLICEHCLAPITEKDGVFKEVTNFKQLVKWVKTRVKKEVNASLFGMDIFTAARKILIQESHQLIKSETFASGGLQHLYFLENSIRVVNSIPEMPDYYTLMAVFRSALYQKIPVVVLFKRYVHLGHIYTEKGAKHDAGLFLLPSQNSSHFVAKQLHRRLKNRVVLVVIAKKNGDDPSSFLNTLMDGFNFLHLCKLDGALHKQFPSSELHQKHTTEIPFLGDDKHVREAKKLENLRNEAKTKGFAINSPNARLSLSHIFADTLDNYRTDDFIKFFAASAQSFAEQTREPRASPSLLSQFLAADKRKAVHEANDRALHDLTPTVSEPGNASKLEAYRIKTNRLHVSSSSHIFRNTRDFLDESRTDESIVAQQIAKRTKSAGHIRLRAVNKLQFPSGKQNDKGTVSERESFLTKSAEHLQPKKSRKHRSTSTGTDENIVRQQITERTQSCGHLVLKINRKHRSPSDVDTDVKIILQQVTGRSKSAVFKNRKHFLRKDAEGTGKTQETSRANSTGQMDTKPQFLSVRVIDQSIIKVRETAWNNPTEQVLIKRERRHHMPSVTMAEKKTAVQKESMSAKAVEDFAKHLGSSEAESIDGVVNARETSRKHSTRRFLIRRERKHQLPSVTDIVESIAKSKLKPTAKSTEHLSLKQRRKHRVPTDTEIDESHVMEQKAMRNNSTGHLPFKQGRKHRFSHTSGELA